VYNEIVTSTLEAFSLVYELDPSVQNSYCWASGLYQTVTGTQTYMSFNALADEVRDIDQLLYSEVINRTNISELCKKYNFLPMLFGLNNVTLNIHKHLHPTTSDYTLTFLLDGANNSLINFYEVPGEVSDPNESFPSSTPVLIEQYEAENKSVFSLNAKTYHNQTIKGGLESVPAFELPMAFFYPLDLKENTIEERNSIIDRLQSL
jgi:hypothetical protein